MYTHLGETRCIMQESHIQFRRLRIRTKRVATVEYIIVFEAAEIHAKHSMKILFSALLKWYLIWKRFFLYIFRIRKSCMHTCEKYVASCKEVIYNFCGLEYIQGHQPLWKIESTDVFETAEILRHDIHQTTGNRKALLSVRSRRNPRQTLKKKNYFLLYSNDIWYGNVSSCI